MDAEGQAEFDLNIDPLPDTLAGVELAREQAVVSALQAQGRGIDWVGFRSWRFVGGSSEDVVLYSSRTIRAAYQHSSESSESSSALGEGWVEHTQAAYRLVHQTNGWRLADRYVFEQTQRRVDVLEFDSVVGPAYRRLWSDVLAAWSGGHVDQLAAVLDGQALDVYQQRLRALLDSGKLEHVRSDGTTYVIDAQGDSAVVLLHGTVTVFEIDPTTGLEGNAVQEPIDVVHDLHATAGQWKIVTVKEPTTQTDADGTVHIAGCADGADDST